MHVWLNLCSKRDINNKISHTIVKIRSKEISPRFSSSPNKNKVHKTVVWYWKKKKKSVLAPTSSPATIWIPQLSTPVASKAESKCSTVRTLTPSVSLLSVVHSTDSDTQSILAGILKRDRPWLPVPPQQRKNLPSPAMAGNSFAVVEAPEWSPVPDRDTSEARVFWSFPV